MTDNTDSPGPPDDRASTPDDSPDDETGSSGHRRTVSDGGDERSDQWDEDSDKWDEDSDEDAAGRDESGDGFDEGDEFGPGAFDFDTGEQASIDPSEVERVFSVLETAITDGELPEEETRRMLSVLETAIVSPIPLDSREIDELLSVLESALTEAPGGQTVSEVLTVLESAILDPARVESTESDGILSVLESAVVGPTNQGSGVEDVFSMLDSAISDPTQTDEDGGAFSLFDIAGLDPETAERRAEDAFSLFDPLNYTGATRRDPGRPPEPEERAPADPFRVARIAAATTQRATDYSLRSGIRTGTRMVRAAGQAESLEDLVEESREIAFDEMERLGLDVGDRGGHRDDWGDGNRIETEAVLKERGARLLEMSADVDYDESVHPAYPHIIKQLTPDEARILRYLATEGPQPAVNIRDVGWVPISSDLVAAGLSMVATEAGCRHEDWTAAYMNNLNRLGLVWFSDEQVDDIKRYQVVEAQPHVKDAKDDCKRPKVVRRSIHLTPLGVDFCRMCLPIEVVSEDAAAAYQPPKDRSSHHKAVDERHGGRQGVRGGRQAGRDAPRDGIENPHRDDSQPPRRE